MPQFNYRELFEAHPQPMWVYDIETLQFIAVNNAAVSHYGYSREEFLQMTIADIRPPADREKLRETVDRSESGLGHSGIWRHRRQDGSHISVEITSHTLNAGDRPARLVMAQDVTQREKLRSEHDLHNEERAAILDALPASIALLDAGGIIRAVNAEWRRFGRENQLNSRNSSVGQSYLAACDNASNDPGTGAKEIASGIRSVLDGSKNRFEQDYPCHSPTRERWFRLIVVPVAAGSIRGAVAMHVNITEQHDLEQRLIQAQKLEVVGQLTGGVAHDFNNLLTVMLGNSELLIDQLSGEQRLLRLATLIKAAADRGAALTSRLLAFSRRQTLQPSATNVGRLLVNMDELLKRTLGENIDIGIINKDGATSALIDASQLENAILNLCINARDAMPAGGMITIEISNVQLDADAIEVSEEVEPGDYVLVSVSDNGVGMTQEVARRAFEPYFTTKEVGRGSGLGLSMVFGFVKQSKGHVRLYSEPNQGTTVKLYLPRAVPPSREDGDEIAKPEITGGTEQILLVEDDDLVRDHAASALQGLGYRVAVASDAEEALEELRQNPDIDLLFTDVVMPGTMSGIDLAAQSRLLRPELPVLFTSGYTADSMERRRLLDDGARLLTKPYRLADLASAVHESIASARSPAEGEG